MSFPYSQEAIDRVLLGSTRQLVCLLDLVKYARVTLENLENLLELNQGTLGHHHRNLTRIRQIIKMVVRRQRVPSYVADFLQETR